MNDHAIYSRKTRYIPPKAPTRIDLEAEIEQCLDEIEGDSEGSAVVGYVVLILFVVFGCSLAYWAVAQL